MTRQDQQILFKALAFTAILLKDNSASYARDAERVEQLAKLFDDFCAPGMSDAEQSN